MAAIFPVISNNVLLLRQFTQSDLPQIFYGLSHPDVIAYYGVQYDSLESAKAQLNFFKNLEENETGVWWAVCSADDKIFYGACGLNNLSKTHKKAEIGFWLLPEYWKKGIMKTVVEMVCSYAFKKLNLHRIEALVETGNIKSKKLLTKLHFNHEGTMKDCEIKNEKFISLDIYARLNHDLTIK